MLFKNHTMTLINNPALIGQEINNMDFVIVASTSSTDELCKHPNVHDVSILLPPPDMLLSWIDGYCILENEYPKYLITNEDADNIIVALLSALTIKNVILYVPAIEDDRGIISRCLFNHLQFMYGVTMRTQTTQFFYDEFNEPKKAILLSKFYMIGSMDAKDYINSYPQDLLLPEWVINKLAEDLRPFNIPATFQQYAEYFNGLVRVNRQVKLMAVKKDDNIHK